MKDLFIPVGIDRKARTDEDFQKRYKPTFEIIGYHKFVRISSLTNLEINHILKGYNKSKIIAELDCTDKELETLTIPIYEENRLHDRFEFVSYLGLPIVVRDRDTDKLVRMTLPGFLTSQGFTAAEIVEEYDIYYDSIRS